MSTNINWRLEYIKEFVRKNDLFIEEEWEQLYQENRLKLSVHHQQVKHSIQQLIKLKVNLVKR